MARKTSGIYKRDNGKYQAQAYLGKDKNGRKLKKSKTFALYSEAKTWKEKLEKSLDNGFDVQGLSMIFSDLRELHLKNLEDKGRKFKTMKFHTLNWDRYLIPLIGEMRIYEIRPMDIEGLEVRVKAIIQSNKSDSRGFSGDRTAFGVYQTLSAALQFAWKNDLIEANPALKADRPKYKAKETKVFSLEEIQHFLYVTEGLKNHLYYIVGVTTHARPGELLGLTWQCIDWKNQSLQISEQVQRVDGEGLQVHDLKTDRSKREISLGSGVLAFLKVVYQERKREWSGDWSDDFPIFPSNNNTFRDSRNLSREYKLDLEMAGFDPKEYTLYSLRHTGITQGIYMGLPIAEVSSRSGHSRNSTTLDFYVHKVKGQSNTGDIMDGLLPDSSK